MAEGTCCHLALEGALQYLRAVAFGLLFGCVAGVFKGVAADGRASPKLHHVAIFSCHWNRGEN